MLHDEKWDLDEDGKIIWSAADYINNVGWVQDVYGSKASGGVCILGAFRDLLGTKTDHSAIDRVYAFLNGRGIVDYNDAEDRTKEQVISMLKQAAKFKP